MMRKLPDSNGNLWLEPGEYGKNPHDGNWYARPPKPEIHAGNLAAHDVTEHEDGTISVSPSILIEGYEGDSVILWHGYLERGVWREC